MPFFPIEEKRYTFGLMGIIGLGYPTLIQVELGFIIQVPDPVILAILGVIKVALPTEQKIGRQTSGQLPGCSRF